MKWRHGRTVATPPKTLVAALSDLDKGLVRRLVYLLTCRFVPGRATARHFVPLRLGTLWARPGQDRGAAPRRFVDPATPVERRQGPGAQTGPSRLSPPLASAPTTVSD